MSRLGQSLARLYYRALLLAYPREFRRRRGDEAAAVFAEACREGWRDGRRVAVARRLWNALGDVLRGGFEERFSGGREGRAGGREGRAADHDPTPERPSRRDRMGLLAELANDLRYAVRSLRRRPGWTLAIVATLALGIGANTAIFSVVEATLLRSSPWPDADRMVTLHTRVLEVDLTTGVPLDELRRWEEEVDAFERVEGSAGRRAVLGHPDGARRVTVSMVTTGYLGALGVEPVVGRLLRADDFRPDASPVTVMPEVLWRRWYGADPEIVGQTVQLDGVVHVVVGVLPEVGDSASFDSFFVPLAASDAAARQARPSGLAWLRPGATVEEARAQLAAVSRGETERLGPHVGEIREPTNVFWELDEFRSALLALLAAVFLVLAIACVNVANLLLASAGTRRGELAVRAALGASRLRLARFLLVESLVLSLMGGLGGLAVARGGMALMRIVRPGGQLGEALDTARLDVTVLAWATALSVLSGLAFGLLPALRGDATGHRGALQGAGPRGGGRQRLRGTLVAAETALSVVLVVAAGLTFRSFVELRLTDPGFDADRILSVGVSLPEARYPDEASRRLFFDELTSRVETIPGVEAVGLGYGATPPSDLVTGGRLLIEGRDLPGAEEVYATVSMVQEGFLELMGIPLLHGRDLGQRDGRNVESAAERPVVVNRSMARRYWPEGDAIGARFRFTVSRDERWNRIVGVAADVPQRGFEAPEGMLHFWMPLADLDRRAELLVRLRPGIAPPVSDIRSVVQRLDPQLPTDGIETAAAGLIDSISGPRFRATLFGSFGFVALALAALGISGVVAYTVTQRTREMGIRLALGAGPGDVRRLVVFQGTAPVLAGIGVGILLAFGVTRLMAGFLHDVAPVDPTTFIGTAVTLCTVGALATWIPARRATRVDPVTALRSE